jgi:plastocyanin
MKVPVTVFGFTAMFMIAIAGQPTPPQPSSRKVTVQGCLSGDAGSLLLKDVRSGRTYQVKGDTQKLAERVGKELKAEGEEQASAQGNPSLEVKNWKPVGDCKAAVDSLARRSANGNPNGEPVVPITGKNGQASAAVPDTNTSSTGEPTPPVNIERSQIRPPQPAGPGSPPAPGAAGQNPRAADSMAVAASRAEIAAGGGTLGVEGEDNSGGRTSSGAASASRSSSRAAATVRMQHNEFAPVRINVAPGQAVEWRNMGEEPHTVVLVPQAATNPADVSLPAGAQPFDSGKIQPGATYSHTFSVPGTYKYFCSMHEGNGMVGEIVVRPR